MAAIEEWVRTTLASLWPLGAVAWGLWLALAVVGATLALFRQRSA